MVLMVAEKPSIAKTLAEALSEGQFKQRSGYSKFLPVHEYYGKLFNQSVQVRVTSVAGHVYSLDFTKEYSNWNTTEPIELFKARTMKIEANPQQKVIKHLEQEAKDCSYLILWLDNDREGENICFEVKNICEKFMVKENVRMQTYRAKFSSLTKKDLKEAYSKLQDPPNLNDCLAVDARQIIDLKVGVAFSRYQTSYFRKKYPDLNERMITFGPCQTPTLGFCVRREDEIKNFKPKLFYRLLLFFSTQDGLQQETQAIYSNETIFNQQEANTLLQKVQNQSSAIIQQIEQEKLIRARPEGLNTVQLLKMGSSYLHLSPQQTMHVAEKLYLSGFITYPRTESTSYAKTFNFDEICQRLCTIDTSSIYESAQYVAQNGICRPRQGVDMGDHPPITPTTYIPQGSQLRGEELNLYEYVCKHFLASISADCSFLKTSLQINVNDQIFKCSGVQIINKGFLEIMDWVSMSENTLPVGLQKGSKVKITSTKLESQYTSPPGYLTETELISLMEKHKIGTDASLATHINTICEREYVKIQGNNRTLIPTDIGRCLVKGYQLIDEQLVLPDIRSQIEGAVDQISKGGKQFKDVLNECLQLFEQKFSNFVQNITKIDVLFSSFYKNVEDSLQEAKPFSKCGQCKRFMKIIEKAGKFFCEECKINLSVPTGGKFKITGEKYCPYDGFQLVFFTSAHPPNVSFDLCPKCYTQSPLIDSDQVTCSICTNDKCDYSMVNRLLRNCQLCGQGDIVLEPQVAQKIAAMCNECWTQWLLPVQSKDLKVNKKEKCKTCESYLLSFKVIQDKKPNQEKAKLKENYENVCLFCEQDIVQELKIMQYTEKKKKSSKRRQKR